MPSLQGLSIELIEKIFLNLDLKDLMNCRCVSPFLRKTIQGSPDLRYRMLLLVSGNIDNPRCNLPAVEKRKILERSEGMWTSKPLIPLALSGELPLSDHFTIKDLLGFTDRFLIFAARANTEDQSKRRSTHLVYVLYPSSVDSFLNTTAAGTSPKVAVIPPPSALKIKRGYILGLSTNIDELGIICVAYGEPDEDEPNQFHVYINIISDPGMLDGTNRLSSIFTMHTMGNETFSATARVEISGENGAIVCRLDYLVEDILVSVFFLSVLEWKTGYRKIVPTLSIEVQSPGLAFLTTELLLVPNVELGSICIYHIIAADVLRSQKRNSKDGLPGVNLIGSLMLPSLPESSFYEELDIQSSPNPMAEGSSKLKHSLPRLSDDGVPDYESNPPKGAPPYTERPFYSDPEQAIVAITMKIRIGEQVDDGTAYTSETRRIFVHRYSLLDVFLPRWKDTRQRENMGATSRDTDGKPDIISVPWEEWGPSRARVLLVPPSGIGYGDYRRGTKENFVYGQRYISMLPIDLRSEDAYEARVEGLVTTVAHLYDFNELTIKIMRQNKLALVEALEKCDAGDDSECTFIHSGIRLGYDDRIKNQLAYKFFDSDLDNTISDSEEKEEDDKDADADDDDSNDNDDDDDEEEEEENGEEEKEEGEEEIVEQNVDGMLPCVRFDIPGLPAIQDIAIDARRIIQEEVIFGRQTLLGLYFG